MAKILILEDDMSIHSLIRLNLKKAKYEVIGATTVKEALDKFRKEENIEIAILDVMLPDGSGVDVCAEIRRINKLIGIMMLTAKSQDEDKILALESGADDYLTKPFSPTELIARVNALYRRVKINTTNLIEEIIISNEFEINVNTRRCLKNGKEIELTPTEFTMLKLFIDNSDEILTREDLLHRIWGDQFYGDIKIVDVNIRRLRRKIEVNPSMPSHIETIWGKGYIWRKRK